MLEPAAVGEPEIDDREGGRRVRRRGDAGGDAVGRLDDEAAPLHGAGQALAQRRVVIDDEERALGLGQALQRGRGLRRALVAVLVSSSFRLIASASCVLARARSAAVKLPPAPFDYDLARRLRQIGEIEPGARCARAGFAR